jgi:hypothetical protein
VVWRIQFRFGREFKPRHLIIIKFFAVDATKIVRLREKVRRKRLFINDLTERRCLKLRRLIW